MNAPSSSRSFADSGWGSHRLRSNRAKQDNEPHQRALLCQVRPDHPKNPQGIIARDELLGVLQGLWPLQVNLVGGGRIALSTDCWWARTSAQFFGGRVILCPEPTRAVTSPAPPVALAGILHGKSLMRREGNCSTQNCIAFQSEFWVEFYAPH